MRRLKSISGVTPGQSITGITSREQRHAARQRLTANAKVNVIRKDFDNLKATLNNCLRYGLESQNRENHAHFRAHLEGRIAFMEFVNREKSKRLHRLFEAIAPRPESTNPD